MIPGQSLLAKNSVAMDTLYSIGFLLTGVVEFIGMAERTCS